MNRKDVIDKLHLDVVDIEFVKADGSARRMQATLSPDYLPSEEEDGAERKKNPDAQVVWDFDKGEWRTFRWDRLTRVDDVPFFDEGYVPSKVRDSVH